MIPPLFVVEERSGRAILLDLAGKRAIIYIFNALKRQCKQVEDDEMIWAKEECLSRAEIEEIQLSRLKEQVAWTYERV